MQSSKSLHIVAYLLLIVGGLNWLLLGLFGWEVGAIFGGSSAILSRIMYVLVGLATIYELLTHKHGCKHCSLDHQLAAPGESSQSGSQPTAQG